MEALIEGFVRVNYDSGNGSGNDSYGCGSGNGDGYAYGGGNGGGYLYGSGSSDGNGYGGGSGSGSGGGNGSGSGNGGGLKTYQGDKIYQIDNIPTIIKSVKHNIAKGFILNGDLTLTQCFIVRENNTFSHGKSLREAFMSLQEKLYNNSTEGERIEKFKGKFRDFNKKYSAKELFVWHHILTGSCKVGRESFCRNKGIDIENDKFTIYEFINLTKNSYNGEIIKKLL